MTEQEFNETKNKIEKYKDLDRNISLFKNGIEKFLKDYQVDYEKDKDKKSKDSISCYRGLHMWHSDNWGQPSEDENVYLTFGLAYKLLIAVQEYIAELEKRKEEI